jgi:hypothetical protein
LNLTIKYKQYLGIIGEDKMGREKLDQAISYNHQSIDSIQSYLDEVPSSPTNEVNVNPGDNLTNVINDMSNGGIIKCAPGSYPEFSISERGNNPLIIIETEGFPDNMPSPQDLPRMAQFPGYTIKNKGANVNFRKIASVSSNRVNQINFGGDKRAMTSMGDVPSNFLFEYCLMLGNLSTRRGIAANCRHLTVRSCYMDDFAQVGTDSQCINGWNGAHDHLIENCFLAAAAENILYGGADPALEEMSPRCVTIRNNEIMKKYEWVGKTLNLKCLIETKNLKGALIYWNKIHGCWKDAWDSGVALTLKSSNQDNTMPTSGSKFLSIINNDIYDVGSYCALAGNSTQNVADPLESVIISGNWMHGMHTSGDGKAFLIGDNPRKILIDHNTIQNNRHSFLYMYACDAQTEVKFTNNIALHGTYGAMKAPDATEAKLIVLNNAIERKQSGTLSSLDPSNKWFDYGTINSMIENGKAIQGSALAAVVTLDAKLIGKYYD